MELDVPNQTEIKRSERIGNQYIHAATSDNTRKAYKSDIKHFENWGGRLPATADIIARYITEFAETLNPRTISRRLIALKHWHRYQGFQDPTDHPNIKKMLSGIKRIHGKPKDKARALTPAELQHMTQPLIQDGSVIALRDAALLQIGLFGAFRRSELVRIQHEHITWSADGIEVLLPTSKTDQEHEGQIVAIPYGNPQLCPITTLKKWLDASGIDQGYLFRRVFRNEEISSNHISETAVNQVIKKRAFEAGIAHFDDFSSHSLRRGLATSAAKAGAPVQVIMRAGRWKQVNTVMEYIEAGERFTENAAKCVIQTIDGE